MNIKNLFKKDINDKFREGDKINIEGEVYLICKTKIGNCNKLRITLKMLKNIKKEVKK
jgi:hypothetical protein